MNPRRTSAGFFLLAALAFGVGTGQAGVKRDLAALQGAKGTVVVFVRSADWCPYCMRQLADVNGRLRQFEALGLSVVSVSVDSVAEIAGFHRAQVVRAKFAERGYRNRPDLDRVLDQSGRLELD